MNLLLLVRKGVFAGNSSGECLLYEKEMIFYAYLLFHFDCNLKLAIYFNPSNVYVI